MKIKNPYLNLLRLDSCFHFLNVYERIALHYARQFGLNNHRICLKYREKITRMTFVLSQMDWEMPPFHIYRFNEETMKPEWCAKGAYRNVSEAEFAKDWVEEFDQFKKLCDE